MRDAVTEINIDNPIARAAFICWWRTMEAQGYQYGFEALCNVWVGFDDGRADLAKKVLEVVDLPALRELFIREGAYVDPAAPGSPSPAEPLDTNNAARWAETYAAGIESQNEVTEPTRIENWSDFHAGQVYAAKQIAAALRTSVGEEGKS